MMRHISLKSCCYMQAVIIVCTILAANLTPPPHGAMLLVSVSGLSTGAILNLAATAGATPLRAGPLRASLIVFGDRNRLLAAGLPAGIIALSSSAAPCGQDNAGRARL